MAKGILEFDLNDPDDAMAHLRCVKSTDMALSLWDIIYEVRKGTKRELEGNEASTDAEFELPIPEYNAGPNGIVIATPEPVFCFTQLPIPEFTTAEVPAIPVI
jgi:hypothetical protein